MVKLKVIKKIIKTPCYCCNEGLYGNARPRKSCPACKGTGKYPETFYYHIYKGQCFTGDTIK
jgi:hypothetical protein